MQESDSEAMPTYGYGHLYLVFMVSFNKILSYPHGTIHTFWIKSRFFYEYINIAQQNWRGKVDVAGRPTRGPDESS